MNRINVVLIFFLFLLVVLTVYVWVFKTGLNYLIREFELDVDEISWFTAFVVLLVTNMAVSISAGRK